MRFGRSSVLFALVFVFAIPPAAQAWSHQGHILITRMACLRIINDPAAPEGLKAFLKKNMKYDLEACRKLATGEMVGETATDYRAGIDGACTLPDRIINTAEGMKEIEPYGAPEAKMHFLDMEHFAKEPIFKADLSNRPDIRTIPRDLKDPRYKAAGFLPLRTDECYKKLVAEFAKPELDNDAAVKALGYLAHYMEDAHQPQHATIDFKSLSYLFGKVEVVRSDTKKTAGGKEYPAYFVPPKTTPKINPHGDVEARLFENTDEPLKTFREQFWKDLIADVDAQTAERAKVDRDAASYDGFTRCLQILSKSYELLPPIGEAAQAAYATQKFDPKAFFSHEATVDGHKTPLITLLAHQNASAVVEVEHTLREAWTAAHK